MNDSRYPPSVDICKYGWSINEIKDTIGNTQYVPQPYIAKIDIAPPGLMDVVSCNCKSTEPCSSKQCSYHKIKLPCTYYCYCNIEHCHTPFTTTSIEHVSDDFLDADDIHDV